MPWTKWSFYPSWKRVTTAAWWWLYCIPLSKRKHLIFWNIFSPNTMTLRIFFYKPDCAVLHMWSWHYWFVNTKCWVKVFNFYLFIFLLHQKWPTKFKMCIHCYLHCSGKEANVVVTLLTSTREINGFQWKRILVLFS